MLRELQSSNLRCFFLASNGTEEAACDQKPWKLILSAKTKHKSICPPDSRNTRNKLLGLQKLALQRKASCDPRLHANRLRLCTRAGFRSRALHGCRQCFSRLIDELMVWCQSVQGDSGCSVKIQAFSPWSGGQIKPELHSQARYFFGGGASSSAWSGSCSAFLASLRTTTAKSQEL